MKPMQLHQFSLLFGGTFLALLGSSSSLVAAGLPTFSSNVVMDHGGKAVSGPAVQIDERGLIHIAWIEGDHDRRNLYHATIPSDTMIPSSPVRVNDLEGSVVSLSEPPAMGLGIQPQEVYLTWAMPHPNGKGKPFYTLLRLSRSIDGGQNFLPSVVVNDDTVPTEHAFDSLAVGQDGLVHLAWIDSREGQQKSATYVTSSPDHGQNIAKNVKLDGGTCVCCRTAIATAPDGSVYAAWRKVFPGNVRETVLAKSSDGGQTFSAPVIVGHDQWSYRACPHQPTSVGVDGQGRLSVAWYTEDDHERSAIYLAFSDDGGRTFSPKLQMNKSQGLFLNQPHMVVASQGHVVVAWEEQSQDRQDVVVSYSLDRGKTFSNPQRLNDHPGKSPAVAINRDGVAVLAWIEQRPTARSTILETIRFPGRDLAATNPDGPAATQRPCHTSR